MSPVDPRPGWLRQRIKELMDAGLSYREAQAQAEKEADEKFGPEGNGNGGVA